MSEESEDREFDREYDPIEPEKTRFFAILVIVAAVAAMTFGAISAYRAMFPPPETHTLSKIGTVILVDAVHCDVVIRVTYQVSGDWVKEDHRATVGSLAYLAALVTSMRFSADQLATDSSGEFTAQVRTSFERDLRTVLPLHSGTIRVIDFSVDIDVGNFRKNSV